jgi:hypothetical protein
MLLLVCVYLSVSCHGSLASESGLDDLLPLLHLSTVTHDETFFAVADSFAAAETAIVRTEDLLKVAVEDVRQKRGVRHKVDIVGTDYFSLAAKRFLETATTRFPEEDNDIAVMFGIMDLVLFAVLYMAKPEWHCQPFLMMYWWMSGILVMTVSQGLSPSEALSMLVQMASTVGYGSNVPRDSSTMFWHAIHSSTGLAAGIGDVMSSLADYVIDNMDRLFHSDGVKAKGPTVLCEAEFLLKILGDKFDPLDDSALEGIPLKDLYEGYLEILNVDDDWKEERGGTDPVEFFEKRVQKWRTHRKQLHLSTKTENKGSMLKIVEAINNEFDMVYFYTPQQKANVDTVCRKTRVFQRLVYRMFSLVVMTALSALYLTFDFIAKPPYKTEGWATNSQKMGHALYCAAITMTSVGYGDIAPGSQVGQIGSPLVVQALVHDYERFAELVGDMNSRHDKSGTFDFVAATQHGHNPDAHSMGITSCPFLYLDLQAHSAHDHDEEGHDHHEARVCQDLLGDMLTDVMNAEATYKSFEDRHGSRGSNLELTSKKARFKCDTAQEFDWLLKEDRMRTDEKTTEEQYEDIANIVKETCLEEKTGTEINIVGLYEDTKNSLEDLLSKCRTN